MLWKDQEVDKAGESSKGERSSTRGVLTAAQDYGLTFGGLLAAQGLSALALDPLARRTPPLAYGSYVSAISLFSLLVVIPGLGLDTWLLVRGGADPDHLMTLWGRAIWLRVVAVTAWLVCVCGLLFIVPQDRYRPAITLGVAISAAFGSILLLNYVALRVRGKQSTVAVLQTIAAAALVISVVASPSWSDQMVRFVVARTGLVRRRPGRCPCHHTAGGSSNSFG